MDILIELLIQGIVTGGVYSLIALGFVIIYKATSVINFATGELMMLGAYFCLTLLTFCGLPFWAVLPLTLLLAGFLGVVIERVILRPLIGQPIISVIMVTIGLASILKGLVFIVWKSDYRSFPQILPTKPLSLGLFKVSPPLLYGFVFAVLGVILSIMIFKYTRIGLAMRATATDQQVAQSMGISVGRVFAFSWALAAGAAAVGGIVIGNISGISPQMGHVGLAVLPVVILGGLDSIGGAIIGGFIIGILENVAGVYLEPILGEGLKEVVPFIVLVIILFIRPYGLFGKAIIERV